MKEESLWEKYESDPKWVTKAVADLRYEVFLGYGASSDASKKTAVEVYEKYFSSLRGMSLWSWGSKHENDLFVNQDDGTKMRRYFMWCTDPRVHFMFVAWTCFRMGEWLEVIQKQKNK